MEYKKPFEDFSENKISQMTFQQIEHNEIQWMEYNAFRVCQELTMQIDRSRAPGCYIKCYTSQKTEDMFFNDHKYLSEYLSASENKM